MLLYCVILRIFIKKHLEKHCFGQNQYGFLKKRSEIEFYISYEAVMCTIPKNNGFRNIFEFLMTLAMDKIFGFW